MTTHPYLAKWYRFCPRCQNKIIPHEENVVRCDECDFVFYNNPATAVVILLINDKGEVLLGRRKSEPRKDCWDNPGGFVDVGESAEETVVREMEEETGLKVSIEKYIGSIPDIYGIGPTLNLVYTVKSPGGEPHPHDDVVELKWFAIKDIPWDKIAFANTKIAVDMYQQYLQKEL